MTAGKRPEICVIVGSQNARSTVVECLTSLTAQAREANAEIILADASGDGTADVAEAQFPEVQCIRAAGSSLVPHLWRLGFERARGRLVAFTNAQCIPGGDWLARILETHRDDVAGVGGPVDGPASTQAIDWAQYFARYSAFLPDGRCGTVSEIAGDNAAYQHAALDLCSTEMAGGFWETLAHRRLRAEGKVLTYNPDMRVRLGSSGQPLTKLAAVRFRHGRHYGSTRPDSTLPRRTARLLGSPLVLPALLVRIARRVKHSRPDWMPQFIQSLPRLTVIVAGWTLGEASGYVWPAHPLAPHLAQGGFGV